MTVPMPTAPSSRPRRRRGRMLALVAPLVLILSGCHVLGNGVDVDVQPDGMGGVQYLEFDKWVDNPGDPNDAESDPGSAKALKIIIEDIDYHCGPSGTDATGSWGTHDTDRTSGFTATGYERRSTTYPDSTMVACAYDHITDDPEDDEDPASLICDIPNSAQDDQGVGDDCQDDETPPNYQVNNPATQFYYDMLEPSLTTSDETGEFLANVYDVYYGTYVWTTSLAQPYRVATCVGGRIDGAQAYPLNGTTTSVASASCLS